VDRGPEGQAASHDETKSILFRDVELVTECAEDAAQEIQHVSLAWRRRIKPVHDRVDSDVLAWRLECRDVELEHEVRRRSQRRRH